jgi:hypothetical protein
MPGTSSCRIGIDSDLATYLATAAALLGRRLDRRDFLTDGYQRQGLASSPEAGIYVRSFKPVKNLHQEEGTMKHGYKSYTIIITTWANLDRYGYTPEFRISEKASKVFQTVKLNNAFATKEEAETFALGVAKKWIDERGGNQPEASTQGTVVKPETPLR